jgi:type VII secretion protein EccB
MASRQDQLHSYQFMVQRVVAALVMRETDPVQSPFRRLAGATLAGVLITALSLAAVAVYGVLAPGGGTDWRDGGAVIVERESGARYVYLDGALHPALNYASARLIIGSAQAHVVSVARRSIEGVPRGAPLGIVGAPDSLPDPAALLGAAWAVCSSRTGDGAGSTLYIGRPPSAGSALGTDTGLLVSTPDGARYLIWRSSRYRLTDLARGALAWSSEPVTVVAPALLNSLAAGPDLAPPVIPDRGRPSKLSGAAVGDVFVESTQGGGRQYAVVQSGGLAPVSQLQADLLLAQAGGAARQITQAAYLAAPKAAPIAPTGAVPLPATTPALAHPTSPEHGICTTIGDGLAVDVPLPDLNTAARTGSVSAAGTVLADRVVVPPGRGAVVEAVASPGAPSGALGVVTDLGTRYAVPSADVLGILGYQGVTPVRVPASVVSLVPAGRPLDPAAARTPLTG